MSNISVYHQQLLKAFSNEGHDRILITREWYEHRIKPYLQFLEIEGVSLVNSGPSEVKRYLTTLTDAKLSWSTRNGTHTALKNWLIARGHVQQNPFAMETIKRPRKTKQVKNLVELETLQTLFDTIRADDSFMARRDYAIILLMFDTGMRRTEAS